MASSKYSINNYSSSITSPAAGPTKSRSKKLFLLLINTSFLLLVFVSLHLKIHIHHVNPGQYYTINNNSASDIGIDVVNHVMKYSSSIHGCAAALDDYSNYTTKCSYVKSHASSCNPKGYINYVELFYCHFGPNNPLLGHVVLLLWLVVLLYLLGDTAAVYFCPSLESLSNTLKLSPTIAGITLLSLGNGAPDVFASIISFTRSDDADVGLNSVLGGAFFVSSAVVGVISLLKHDDERSSSSLDRTSFIRDVTFFLFSLSSLLAILVAGRINIWGALAFFAIYFVYVCSVSATHFFCVNKKTTSSIMLILNDDDGDLEETRPGAVPLLGYVDGDDEGEKAIGADSDHDGTASMNIILSRLKGLGKVIANVLKLPLYLPRRASIPVVREDQWSKPYAVISASVAPILMAALCNTQRDNVDSRTQIVTYMTAGLVGIVLGNLAYVTTNPYVPPKQCLFPWLVGGFLMSVTWTYILAEELISLLLSLGTVFGISPSVLGLTVLAWGNSLGDLIANVAMALRGGPNGAQIAMSGCYAGPMFNTVVGLGFSLVLSAWSEYPSPYMVPQDHSLYETVGFLMAGLLWALVVLPNNKMRLHRPLGIGLLAIYSCFLFLRLTRILGFI